MIKGLTVRAKPASKIAHKLSAGLLIAAALLFATRFFIDRFVGIIDIFTIACITASVFLYTKYISSSYIYETMITDDGEPLFLVKRITGKKETTLCRVGFCEILSIKSETREEFKKHKTPPGVLKYLYTPTLFPQKIYRIQTRSAYERAEVVIECSDEFAALISEWAREAREAYLAWEE